MPQMANIVLNDAASTPVAHTFKPMSLRNDVGSYSDSANGTVQTWPGITISVRPATVNNAGHKVVMRLTMPHPLQDEAGVCCVPPGTVLPSSQFEVSFLRSSKATEADIATLLKFLEQAVKDNQFVATAKGESLR